MNEKWEQGAKMRSRTRYLLCFEIQAKGNIPGEGRPKPLPGTRRRGPPHCRRGTSCCHSPLPETWREVMHMANIREDRLLWLQDTDMRLNKSLFLQKQQYFMIKKCVISAAWHTDHVSVSLQLDKDWKSLTADINHGAKWVLILFVLTWWLLGKAHRYIGRWDQRR